MGDIIAVEDYECPYAPGYWGGAMSVGIVGHGDSVRTGFGPGMTMFMTGSSSEIVPVQDPQANLAHLLGLGAHR